MLWPRLFTIQHFSSSFLWIRSNATKLCPNAGTVFVWVSDVLASVRRASSSRARRCKSRQTTSSRLPALKSDGWGPVKNAGRPSIAAPRLGRRVAVASSAICLASTLQSRISRRSANPLPSPPAPWQALQLLLRDSRRLLRFSPWMLANGQIPHYCTSLVLILRGK